jgi:2-dehydropantoate 2-reductase
MKLLIVGAGSTGGYFGGRLLQAGRDLTFLVRPQRAEQLRARGLVLISPQGDARLRPRLKTAAELTEPYDVILLTVKGFALEAALDDMTPAVRADTVILPVLNGMRHIDILRARFGKEAVGGCVCRVATTLDEDGQVIQINALHEIIYGEFDGRPSRRMHALDRFMADAGFDARLSSAIEREMWEKWMLLASVNATICLMRGNLGEVEAASEGRDFILAVLNEVVAVISAVGVSPSEAAVTEVRAQSTQKGSNQTSSMYRDLEKGRRVEVEEIIGDLVRRGRAASIPVPLLAAAYCHLAVYSARLQRDLSASR